jgi:hypothetical protein
MTCRGCELVAALSAALVLAACSSVPANTPRLIDLTSERIENQSTVLLKGYQNVLDQSRFSKDDAADAKQALEQIDASKLSADEQKALAAANKAIVSIQKGLDFKGNYDTLADKSKKVFEEVVASLKVVRQVVATEVDKKQLVQEALQTLNQVKGDSK